MRRLSEQDVMVSSASMDQGGESASLRPRVRFTVEAGFLFGHENVFDFGFLFYHQSTSYIAFKVGQVIEQSVCTKTKHFICRVQYIAHIGVAH